MLAIGGAKTMTERKVKLVHDDREVLTLIENLIQNTTPSHSKSSDPFWESVTRSLTVKSRRTGNGYPLLG